MKLPEPKKLAPKSNLSTRLQTITWLVHALSLAHEDAKKVVPGTQRS